MNDYPTISYSEFVDEYYTNILPNKPNSSRNGQALMNYLSDVWFEEYKRISSIHYYDRTDIDCFYNDNLIQNTLKHLEEVWKHKNYDNFKPCDSYPLCRSHKCDCYELWLITK